MSWGYVQNVRKASIGPMSASPSRISMGSLLVNSPQVRSQKMDPGALDLRALKDMGQCRHHPYAIPLSPESHSRLNISVTCEQASKGPRLKSISLLNQLGCIFQHNYLCIMPLKFDFAASFNHNRRLSSFLAGNWTVEGELLMHQLLFQIAQLNGTRVKSISLGDFTSWLSSAFSFFKERVGVALFGAVLLCGLVFCLWLLCHLKRQH